MFSGTKPKKMKHKIQYLRCIFAAAILGLPVIFASCTSGTKLSENIQIVREDYNTDIFLREIKYHEETFQQGIAGFSLEVEVAFHSNYPKRINEVYPDASQLMLVASLIREDGSAVSYIEFQGDSLIKYPASDTVIVEGFNKKNNPLFIPFRRLDLPAGEHPLHLVLELYPLSNIIEESYEDSIVPPQLTSVRDCRVIVALKVKQPPVQSVKFIMQYIEIDTDKYDPSSADFALFGPGYPDMYWAIVAGRKLVYASKDVTNVTVLDVPEVSPTMRFSSRDSLSIEVADYDSFNKNDLIERIEAVLLPSGHDTIKLMYNNHGNLRRAEFQVVMIKE
jgi:hypothetical protein